MTDTTSKYLLSDADSLRRIKFAQFRAQVPALVAVAVAIALKTIFPSAGQWLYNLALALAILAIAVYFFIGLCFRYRQRIPLPSQSALLSPLEGRIDSIRSSEGALLVNVRKKLLDSVELRSPHSDCRLEDGSLFLDTPQGRISFRFSFKHINWFVDPDLSAGSIIGYVTGNGSCLVRFPVPPELAVQTGGAVKAADPLVLDFSIPVVTEPIQVTENSPQPGDEGEPA